MEYVLEQRFYYLLLKKSIALGFFIGKANSESDFNENSFENTKEKNN